MRLTTRVTVASAPSIDPANSKFIIEGYTNGAHYQVQVSREQRVPVYEDSNGSSYYRTKLMALANEYLTAILDWLDTPPVAQRLAGTEKAATLAVLSRVICAHQL
jgi:hypothetical protein